MVFDTPHGSRPDGCSGNACGNPLRELLKGLPGPKSQETLTPSPTPSPGERGAQNTTLAHAQRTTSNRRECCSPQERFPAEPANTLGWVRCKMPTNRVVHQRADSARMQGLLAHAKTCLTAWGKNPAACGGPKPFSVTVQIAHGNRSSVQLMFFKRPVEPGRAIDDAL